ncbi:MAG: hypothetical protein R2705_20270 [Ilumatobacteraceae bacterium]
MPNIAVPIVSYALLSAGIVVAIEGALSFFGLGVPEQYTTWGKLIAAGQERVDSAPHLSLVPAGAIVFTVLAFSAVSERWQMKFLFGGIPPKAVADEGTDQVAVETVELDDTVPGLAGCCRSRISTPDPDPVRKRPAVRRGHPGTRSGKMTALVGESGSGKTMLARSVLGLVTHPTDPAAGHGSSSPGTTCAGSTRRR